jgi:hypothetical protein
MDMLKRLAQIGVFAIALAASVSRPAGAAEEATIKAFSAWQGQGHLFETGAAELTFVGALTGVMYIDTERGPLASGAMVCPAVVTINTEDGSQDGKGRCVITANDGARVYAEIACAGFHLIGCDGEFKLTGGTGRFQGISGGGHVTIRSEFGQVTPLSKAAAQEEAAGILYLRELHYSIP